MFKNKIIVILLILSFIGVTFSTNIGAEKFEDKQSTNDSGTIYGHTISSYCWSWNPIPSVKVRVGLEITRSENDGSYSISGLPLDVPLKITARKFVFYSDCKTITLTDDEPEEYLILDVKPFGCISNNY